MVWAKSGLSLGVKVSIRFRFLWKTFPSQVAAQGMEYVVVSRYEVMPSEECKKVWDWVEEMVA